MLMGMDGMINGNYESPSLTPAKNTAENSYPFFLPQIDSVSQSTLNSAAISIQHNPAPTNTKSRLDSLMQVSERRERLIYYQTQQKAKAADTVKLVTDTLRTKYSLYNFPFKEPKEIRFSDFYVLRPLRQINFDSIKTSKIISQSQPAKNPGFIEGTPRNRYNLDALTLTIIISLFVISFLKVTYNKFITQIITGLVNFQVAYRLFRERNVLFRNFSIGLNFVFYVNTGLFVYFLLETLHVPQLYEGIFRNTLLYSLIILVIYNVKNWVNRLIGYIFLVQEEIAEYIHNISLYNKNIGLFLIPIIILYPYVLDHLKPFISYFGAVIIGIVILLRFYRGFQIIMRKGISIFYLILYLCAIEILPTIILAKFVNTLIS